jgi:hypothetical protein
MEKAPSCNLAHCPENKNQGNKADDNDVTGYHIRKRRIIKATGLMKILQIQPNRDDFYYKVRPEARKYDPRNASLN